MDSIHDSVPEHLKCPICFEMPEDKVFQCKDGHILCEECFSQLTECPQCRVKFGKEGIRNRLLENLLDDLELDCPYSNSGCTEKFGRNSMRDHLENCYFNIAKFGLFVKICQLFGDENCSFQLNHGNTDEAIQHFAKEHSISVVEDLSTSTILSIKNVDMDLFKRSDIHYFGTEIFDRRAYGGYAILLLAIFNKSEMSAAMIPLYMASKNVVCEPQFKAGLHVEFSIGWPQNEPSSSLPNTTDQIIQIPLKWGVAPIDILKVERILPDMYPFRFPLSLLEKYSDEDGSLSIQCSVKNEQSYLALETSSPYPYPVRVGPSTIGIRNLSLEDEADTGAGASAPLYEDITPRPPPPPIRPRLSRGRGTSTRGGYQMRLRSSRRIPPLPPSTATTEQSSTPTTSSSTTLSNTLNPAPPPLFRKRSDHPGKEKHILPNENCRKCSGKLDKLAFTCLQCENVTLCKRCMRRGEHNHLFAIILSPTHFDKLKIATARTKVLLPVSSEIDRWWDTYSFSSRLNLNNKLKELNEKCAHCDDRRVSFVCLECGPPNVPICKSCLKKRSHNSDHVLAETGLFDRKSDARRKFLLHFQLERNMRRFL